MEQEGSIVIVTGAGRGVGRETTNALVREHGARVIAVARDAKALNALVADHPDGSVEACPADLSVPTGAAEVAHKVGTRRVRAVVQCAGMLLKKPLEAIDWADLEHLFATNVFSQVALVRSVVDRLEVSSPAHLVFISSMGGYQDSAKFPGMAAYSASKAALACLAQCLAEEFKDRGIRSNCLALGAVDTEMLRAAFPGYRAPVSATDMGRYVADFALRGHFLYNGKVLPVAVSTP